MSRANFKFEPVEGFNGLQIITPFCASDDRGEYRKTYEQNLFKEHGIGIPAEIGESISRKGVIRGLHTQYVRPQPKLVRVIVGTVFDVAVDVRKGSPTFGKHYSVILSGQNKKMLYIPAGFLHGLMALEDNTVFNYPSFSEYCFEADGGVKWDDPALNIQWPIDCVERVIVSEKDQHLQCFSEFVQKHGGL